MFKKMGDAEILDCIRENKTLFVSSTDDAEVLLDVFRSVIEADERYSSMENYFLKVVDRILASDE